jgi:hypothetical protein
MKTFNAAGTEGCLLIYPDFSTAIYTDKVNARGQQIMECSGTIVVFRIYEYDENGKHKMIDGHTVFKDYKINHHDLKIKLLDGQFYETDKGNFIDYPDTRYKDEHETSDSDSA